MTEKETNLLDLFAGSRSMANAAEARGLKTFAVDIEKFDKIDLRANILDVKVSDIPFIPDIIWASPPCTFFSVASIGRHWYPNHTPKTQQAVLGMSIVRKTVELINEFTIINPNLIWFMENPRGKLRKLEVVSGLHRETVCYCKYGENRMKPTDIWTNSKIWKPREMCFNGNLDCHHKPAPRGSQTGTQGMGSAYEKSKVPVELCNEILDSCGVAK